MKMAAGGREKVSGWEGKEMAAGRREKEWWRMEKQGNDNGGVWERKEILGGRGRKVNNGGWERKGYGEGRGTGGWESGKRKERK
jgi:hypothetical protein